MKVLPSLLYVLSVVAVFVGVASIFAWVHGANRHDHANPRPATVEPATHVLDGSTMFRDFGRNHAVASLRYDGRRVEVRARFVRTQKDGDTYHVGVWDVYGRTAVVCYTDAKRIMATEPMKYGDLIVVTGVVHASRFGVEKLTDCDIRPYVPTMPRCE